MKCQEKRCSKLPEFATVEELEAHRQRHDEEQSRRLHDEGLCHRLDEITSTIESILSGGEDGYIMLGVPLVERLEIAEGILRRLREDMRERAQSRRSSPP